MSQATTTSDQRPMVQRLAATVLGGLLILLGTLMLVLPGPGIVVILLGLGVLGTTSAWARRARVRLQAATAHVVRRAR